MAAKGKMKVYYDRKQRGYIAGASAAEVRDLLMYGKQQFTDNVREATGSEHFMAARALKNPGGLYLTGAPSN